MSLPDVVSREEWLAARKELLTREKAMTRAIDALNADRRRLPMVLVDKDYRFTGPDGEVGLLDLFEGRRQLVLQHFMFDPSWDDGCPSCTAGVDEISAGMLDHLWARDTTYVAVSRAPFAKVADYKERRGWTLPWYSSYGSDFNYDFHVSIDAAKAPIMFNYRDLDELTAAGMGWVGDGPSEQPGTSCFLRVPGDGGEGEGGEGADQVFHTYSTFARGNDHWGGAYGALDLTALGRQEEWEEPKGRSGAGAHGADPSFKA